MRSFAKLKILSASVSTIDKPIGWHVLLISCLHQPRYLPTWLETLLCAGGGVIDTAAVTDAPYVISYNAHDALGNTAVPVVRFVHVYNPCIPEAYCTQTGKPCSPYLTIQSVLIFFCCFGLAALPLLPYSSCLAPAVLPWLLFLHLSACHGPAMVLLSTGCPVLDALSWPSCLFHSALPYFALRAALPLLLCLATLHLAHVKQHPAHSVCQQ